LRLSARQRLQGRRKERIAITAEAFAAIEAALPLGTVAYAADVRRSGRAADLA
jgi:hypothetical protein